MRDEKSKKDTVKIVVALVIFLLMYILNIDWIVGFLSVFLSEKAMTFLSRLVYAGAIADFLYIFMGLLKTVCNKVILKEHKVVKNNIESKIARYQTMDISGDVSLNVAEIINKIIDSYKTENVHEYSTRFFKKLEDSFHGDSEASATISYFVLANKTYDSIAWYIENNESFHKDCLINHKKVLSELKDYDFNNNDSQFNEIECNEYNDVLIHLLHALLESDPVNNETIEFLRSFYSWFCENMHKSRKTLGEERFIILLQFIPSVADKINSYFVEKNGKKVITWRSFGYIKLKLLIKFLANKSAFRLYKKIGSEIMTQSTIETYARYAGLVTRYYNSVFAINKVVLFITVLSRNHTLNRSYHKIPADYAVSLLLASETMVSNINSQERVTDKLTNLIISVAGFAI